MGEVSEVLDDPLARQCVLIECKNHPKSEDIRSGSFGGSYVEGGYEDGDVRDLFTVFFSLITVIKAVDRRFDLLPLPFALRSQRLHGKKRKLQN